MGLTTPSLVLSYLKTIRGILKCSVTDMFLNTVDTTNKSQTNWQQAINEIGLNCVSMRYFYTFILNI